MIWENCYDSKQRSFLLIRSNRLLKARYFFIQIGCMKNKRCICFMGWKTLFDDFLENIPVEVCNRLYRQVALYTLFIEGLLIQYVALQPQHAQDGIFFGMRWVFILATGIYLVLFKVAPKSLVEAEEHFDKSTMWAIRAGLVVNVFGSIMTCVVPFFMK